MTDTTAVVALPTERELAVLLKSEVGLTPMLEKLAKVARDEASKHDVKTEEGRKAIVKIAYDVSKSKAELDRQGLALTEQARAEVAAVNKGRKAAEVFLADLRNEIRDPVTKFEEAEALRILLHENSLLVFALDRATIDSSIEALDHVLTEIKEAPTGEVWEEYVDAADRMRVLAIDHYQSLRDRVAKAIADQAELVAMREKAAALEKAEADRIAGELKTQAIKQAAAGLRTEIRNFAKGPAEPDRLSAVGLRDAWFTILHQLKTCQIMPEWGEHAEGLSEQLEDAIEKAESRLADAQRKVDAEIAEREALAVKKAEDLAAEKAAADKAAAEVKAEADRVALAQRHADELAEVQRKADQKAADDEAERVAKIAADKDEAYRRAADQKHRDTIRDDIATSLAGFVPDDMARLLADTVMDGGIPHLKVML